jgi:hypothetical protein
MIENTRDLGVHIGCGATIVEVKIVHPRKVSNGDCFCEDPACWDTHDKWEDRTDYYIGCPGCNSIKTASIFPYNSKDGYFILPIHGDSRWEARLEEKEEDDAVA